MRAVVQRVRRAAVSAEGKQCGAIGLGLLVFLGVGCEDSGVDVEWMAGKLAAVRIFEDEEGKMNRSVCEVDGEVLLISQFTLYGNLKKGTRPSFNRSAAPEVAVPLYEAVHMELERLLGKPVPTGVFGAMMHIEAEHDGPVTLVLDSAQRGF